MTAQRLSPVLQLEVKRASVDTQGMFTGYASTFGGPPDSYGDIIVKGAFTDAIAGHKREGTMPAMLWAHDMSEPVGRWLSVEEDSHGLVVTGKVTTGTKRGADAYALLKDNALGLSIGFTVQKSGTEMVNGLRHIKQVSRLVEVSLVSLPANTRARVTEVKGRPDTPRDFEHLLRDVAGFSAREAKRVTAGGWGALVREERGSTDLDCVYREIEELKNLILSTR